MDFLSAWAKRQVEVASAHRIIMQSGMVRLGHTRAVPTFDESVWPS